MPHAANEFAVVRAPRLFSLAVANRHDLLLHHPPMTGVPQLRVMFTGLCQQWFQYPLRITQQGAVPRLVNQRCGHSAVDPCLLERLKTIRECVFDQRPVDALPGLTPSRSLNLLMGNR